MPSIFSFSPFPSTKKKKSILKLFQLFVLNCDKDIKELLPGEQGPVLHLRPRGGQDAQAGIRMFLEGMTLVHAPGEHVCHISGLPPVQPHCRQGKGVGQRDTEVTKMITALFSLGLARVAIKKKKKKACSFKT